MKRVFRFTHRAALYLLFSALLALALFFSVLRAWLLPQVEEFRSSLESHIGSLIGEKVRIDRLAARLYGFHPEVTIKGFHILDSEGRSAIRFDTVRLNLDSFRTVAEGEPRFDRVEVVGPKLSVRRKPDGSIAVLGLTIMEKPPAWLLAGGRIDLLDAEVDWQDQTSQAPPLRLGSVDLRLRNDGERHRLSADFALPHDVGRSLRLALDAEGDLFEANGWRGTVYLETHGLDAGRLVGGYRPSDFGIRSGTADAKIWMRWHDGPSWAAGEFEIHAPVLAAATETQEHRIALKSLASRFQWERQARGWQLDLDRFRPVSSRPWPETRLAVAVGQRPDGNLDSIAAYASHLDLADLATVLQALPVLDADAAAASRSLAPHGTLKQLRGYFAPSESIGRRLALCGGFQDARITAARGIPGFSGLHGDFCGTDAAGSATLSAAPGQLVLAEQGMKRPVPLAGFEASLSWRHADTGWTLDIPELRARNQELSLAGRIRIDLPERPELSPFLDLQARISDLEVAAARHYMPVNLIPGTAKWVERALTGGRISRWDILFRGHTADYPFQQREGVFQAELDAANVTMRYSPNWPELAKARIHAAFQGAGAEVTAYDGSLGAGKVVEAHGTIANMNRNPRLALTGSVRAGLADALDFLAQSPLRNIPERLRRIASVSGDADIALNLEIPLDDSESETGVDGTANLQGATLRLAEPDLAAENLEGLLHFTQHGLRAEAIRARIFGEPALIDVDHEDDDILLTIRGRAGIATLQEKFPADAWRHAAGAAGYRLDLRLPETLDPHTAPIALALSSDLSGIALDLPAPLGKSHAEARSLSLETRIRAGNPIPLRLAYGPGLRARLRFSSPEQGFRPESGEIAIGQPLPLTERASGLTLSAHLDTLDAGTWSRWARAAFAESAGAGLLQELQLHIGKLFWNSSEWGRLALDLKRDRGSWQGRIDSNFARGRISAAKDLARFDLESLGFPKSSAPLAGGNPAPAPAIDTPDIDPATVPGLQIRSRHFLWKGADLGPLELDTERRAHGMIIKGLNVRAKGHGLKLVGNWTRTPNRPASTHLEGKMHIDRLGEFLALLGRGGEVRETASDLDFTLDWPGAPYRFSAATVAGEMKLNFGKGGLLNIEPGLGRVVGMLNLNSLWRRLSLDFSDLFGKGLAYDGIAGTFRIGGGQAVTEAFLVDAVSAKILITGRVGLIARDLDQIVTVIPHTTAALPIAGALAGGPAVGAAVYVAQRLVGEEVDRLAATQYAARGSWDSPEITRINHNMPLDMLDKAWSGVKNLSGFGKQEEQKQ